MLNLNYFITEGDHSPEIISVSISLFLITTILIYTIIDFDLRDKTFLQKTMILIFLCYAGLGGYCHWVGATFTLPEHGYLPIILISFQTILYAIGPLRVSINYLQAMSNDSNVFIARLIFSSVTWLAAFISTGVFPILIEYVGTGWIFWYMAIICKLCYFFIKYCMPELNHTVVEAMILENDKSSIESSIEES